MALNLAAIPQPAKALGFAGLIPFVGLTALAWLTGGERSALALLTLMAYGTAILSFMGGVHWGLAMAQRDASYARLGASVAPALIGWVGLALGLSLGFGMGIGFVLLAAGFAALLAYDLRQVQEGKAPDWYPHLRWPLTAIVVACMILGALRA